MDRICSCELNQSLVDCLVEEELCLRKMKANVSLIFQYTRAIKSMTLYNKSLYKYINGNCINEIDIPFQ